MFWKPHLFLSSNEKLGRHLLSWDYWKELILITGLWSRLVFEQWLNVPLSNTPNSLSAFPPFYLWTKEMEFLKHCVLSGIPDNAQSLETYHVICNGAKRAGVSHPSPWGQKQIQFPKCCLILCSFEYQMMDKVQKSSNPECYTPSSETFKK